MPKIAVVFYQEVAGTVPVLDWLTVSPPKRKISAGYASSGCEIWATNCGARKQITCGMVFTSCVSDFGA